MSARTVFIGKMAGFYLLVFALYLLVQRENAITTLTALVQSLPLLLVCALLGTTAGLAIVLTHNVWTGGAFPVVVTILGWLALLKGVTLMLLAPAAAWAYWGAWHFAQFFNLYDGVLFVIALYLIVSAFTNRG